MEYETAEVGTSPRRSLLPLLLLPLVAFLAGLAAMGWLLANWSTGATLIGVEPKPPAVQPQPQKAVGPAVQSSAAPAAGEPERLVIDPEITRRVNELEQRLADIQTQSREAVGNADRAEGLLVAFAARRALDRGVQLGYLEGLLRQRFGATQAQAVGTVITAAREPTTVQELQAGFEEIAPQLRGGGPNQNWWDALRAELGTIVTVRKADTPSTLPSERLNRARQSLEAGEVAVALGEVLRMPGRESARAWIEDARRYISARRALDTIETAALLDPTNPPETARSAAAAAR